MPLHRSLYRDTVNSCSGTARRCWASVQVVASWWVAWDACTHWIEGFPLALGGGGNYGARDTIVLFLVAAVDTWMKFDADVSLKVNHVNIIAPSRMYWTAGDDLVGWPD